MATEQTPKPEDAYGLDEWNKLEKAYPGQWTKDVNSRAFRVSSASSITIDDAGNPTGGVLFGLKDEHSVMSITWITPAQARAIGTMLLYAAQRAEDAEQQEKEGTA